MSNYENIVETCIHKNIPGHNIDFLQLIYKNHAGHTCHYDITMKTLLAGTQN